MAAVFAACGGCAGGGQGPVYETQRAISLIAAEMKLVRAGNITDAQVQRATVELRPGDLVFRRRYGNFTNNFVPGFWTHSAIYLGSADDLRQMGMDGSPPVEAYLRRHPNAPSSVLEARAVGVIVSPLTAVMDADNILVLRPLLPPKQVAGAIARAMTFRGRPYDYDFDATTPDKLTCAELLWRAYGQALGVGPHEHFGRRQVLPEDYVRFYEDSTADGVAPMSFVLLLTSPDMDSPARFAGAHEIP